jgi:hypothetical protein
MLIRRAFAHTDLLAVLFFLAVSATILLGLAPRPRGPGPVTFNNLRIIGQAAAAYRMDFDNYLPLVLSYGHRGTTPRPGNVLEGWCVWSFGGKNQDSHWGLQSFDIEAADRPLNPYVIPDEFFYAPSFPVALPANHPARTQAQAPMFQDPQDNRSYQRNWPTPTNTISGYNDVGTSYMFNMAWWEQFRTLQFVERFHEGTRRIAGEQGAHPSRFVWLTDQIGDILTFEQRNRSLRINNFYGDDNFAPMLFLDGHTSYEHITPTIQSTPRYTFWFES